MEPGAFGGAPLKLTVKEKVLLELRLHMCEDGLGEYPIELTQKGLSDCLGVRRSHIALSLQGLVEDKLVDVRKERIEGETRKQNIYTLTPTGMEKAKEVTASVLSAEGDFEMLEGVRRVTTEEFLKISKADLSSVVRQLERGSVIRDEITIITRPERKLITVYCPTCKKNLEVENTYADETVSFDCPGCGRPYKIAPEEKVSLHVEHRAIETAWPMVVAVIAFFGAILGLRAFQESAFCSSIIVVIALALSLAVYIAARPRRGGGSSQPKRRTAATISLVAIVLGYGLVAAWGLLVGNVNLTETLAWYVPLIGGVMLGYVGFVKMSSDLAHEYLLVLGTFFAMLAILLVSITLGGLTQSAAPFMGILGVTLLVIAATSMMERNLWVLDIVMAGGAFILLVSVAELLPSANSTIGWIAVGGLVLLGAVLVSLRLLQRRTEMPLGNLLVSALPFAVGALFLMTGILMIDGGSVAPGLIEIGLMVPFIYYGLRKVFDGQWMYRLPVASLLVTVEVLSVTYAFMS